MVANLDNYTLDESPELNITFPPEYKFHWFTFTPSAKISIATLNPENLKEILYDDQTLTVSSVSYI